MVVVVVVVVVVCQSAIRCTRSCVGAVRATDWSSQVSRVNPVAVAEVVEQDVRVEIRHGAEAESGVALTCLVFGQQVQRVVTRAVIALELRDVCERVARGPRRRESCSSATW